MSPVAVAAVGGPVALLLLGPWLAARLFDRRAPARTVATFHLLALLGLAALPLVIATCLLLVRPGDLGTPHQVRVAQAAVAGLGTAYLLRVARAALRARRATARLRTDTALAATEPLPAAAGIPGSVLAVRRPVAYALGGRAARVVVSQGLLALLDGPERDAVIAHELAHIRLRHHRLLLFALVARTALGKAAPAARRAHASLARELEVIADEAAARIVGDRRLVARALAKTALAGPGHGTATTFNHERDLAYRIERLTTDRPRTERRAVAGAAVGLLAASLIVTFGIPLSPPRLAPDVIPYALSLAGVGWLACRGVAPVGSRRLGVGTRAG